MMPLRDSCMVDFKSGACHNPVTSPRVTAEGAEWQACSVWSLPFPGPVEPWSEPERVHFGNHSPKENFYFANSPLTHLEGSVFFSSVQ